MTQTEIRAKAYYNLSQVKLEQARRALYATKPWEVLFMPWRVILRFADYRHWSIMEVARFKAGVNAFGGLRFMEIIHGVDSENADDLHP